MEYICLAAGKGRRFGNLGRYLQKCMYPVGLRPFLEFSVRNLTRSRYLVPDRDKLVLVVGHRAEQVMDYFGEAYQGLAIEYLEQPEPLGTGHALHLVYRRYGFSRPVIAWLADLFVPTALFEKVYAHPEDDVQTLSPGPEGESDMIRVSTAGERVTRAWCGSSDLFDIGLWKLSPGVLQLMTNRQEGEYRVLPNLQDAIEAGRRVGFVRTDAWLHLGGTVPTVEANLQAVLNRILENG